MRPRDVALCAVFNAAEFEPFAVRLDPETMLYQVVPDFDLDEWRDSLETARSSDDKLTVDALLALLPASGSIPKSTVIERLRDKGIGERKVREFIAAMVAPGGLVNQWHVKRSTKRDDIHLSRERQSDGER